jgi:hypothetical protein
MVNFWDENEEFSKRLSDLAPRGEHGVRQAAGIMSEADSLEADQLPFGGRLDELAPGYEEAHLQKSESMFRGGKPKAPPPPSDADSFAGISKVAEKSDLPFGSEEKRLAEGRPIRKFTNREGMGDDWEYRPDQDEKAAMTPGGGSVSTMDFSKKEDPKLTTAKKREQHVEALRQNALRNPRAEAQKKAMERMQEFMRYQTDNKPFNSLEPDHQAHVLKEYHAFVSRIEQEQSLEIQAEARGLGITSSEMKRQAGVAGIGREEGRKDEEHALKLEELKRDYINDLHEYLEERYPRNDMDGVRVDQGKYERDLMHGMQRINDQFGGGAAGSTMRNRLSKYPPERLEELKKQIAKEMPPPGRDAGQQANDQWRSKVTKRLLEMLEGEEKPGEAGIKITGDLNKSLATKAITGAALNLMTLGSAMPGV